MLNVLKDVSTLLYLYLLSVSSEFSTVEAWVVRDKMDYLKIFTIWHNSTAGMKHICEFIKRDLDVRGLF